MQIRASPLQRTGLTYPSLPWLSSLRKGQADILWLKERRAGEAELLKTAGMLVVERCEKARLKLRCRHVKITSSNYMDVFVVIRRGTTKG